MPFTPAHVAAVLPLRRLRHVALPLAALAAGSMSPDLPYYVPPLAVLNRWTHTVAGIVTVDLILGLILWAAWRSIARSLHDLSPAPVRERWTPAGPPGAWWVVPLAVAIGAATHVGWDEFTHPGRFGATHVPLLAASYPGLLGPLPGYQYAQYLSGAFGLVAVVWVALRQARRPVRPPTSPVLARALPWVCAVAGAAGAAVRVAMAGGPGIGLPATTFAVLTGGIGAAGAALLAVCWTHALRGRAGPAPA